PPARRVTQPVLLAVGRGERGPARQPQPVRQPAVCDLPDAVRAAVRRLLLPGQLLDAAQPLPARCGLVPIAVRGAGRAFLPPEPRRSGRADGVGDEPAALYWPEIGLALSQGVRL